MIRLGSIQDLDEILRISTTGYSNDAFLGTADTNRWQHYVTNVILDGIHGVGDRRLFVCDTGGDTGDGTGGYTPGEILGYTTVTTLIPEHTNDKLVELCYIHTDTYISAWSKVKTLILLMGNVEHYGMEVGAKGIVTSSYLPNWESFMKIHSRLGYTIRGSIAYKNIGDIDE